MRIGKCALCLREGQELQNSHFISAAIYQVCKDGNKQPIMVGGGTARHTSGQMADELLCRDCEKRFSNNGEAWTIANMARQRGFPIQEALKKVRPLSQNDRLQVFGEVPGVSIDHLTYFALSIFWRASVHKWLEPNTNRPIQTISLGEYEEPIRQFLLGGPWPQDVVILISVWPHSDPPLAAHTPVSAQRNGFETAMFSIPGLTFTLAIGKGIPQQLRQMCSFSRRMVYASKDQAAFAIQSYGSKVEGSAPTGKLATEHPSGSASRSKKSKRKKSA